MATKTGVLVKVDNDSYLKQPNQVTYMRHDLNTVQIRTLVIVIERLQKEIEFSIANRQLSLFDDRERTLRFDVPLKAFGVKANHYEQLKESLLKIASISVEVPIVDVDGKKYRMIAGLLRAIVPDDEYAKSVIIEVDTHVARHLTKITNGYTKFLKDIVMSNPNKYAQRFYLLISSFRPKPVFAIKYENLKKMLKIEKKYARFKDFDKRVLKIAKDALWEKSDIWFDYSVIYKEDSKEVDRIIFYLYEGIIKEEDYKKNKGCKTQFEAVIRRHYTLLNDEQINDLVRLVDYKNYENILITLSEISAVAQSDKIINKSNYIYSSLMKEFAPTIGDGDVEVVELIGDI